MVTDCGSKRHRPANADGLFAIRVRAGPASLRRRLDPRPTCRWQKRVRPPSSSSAIWRKEFCPFARRRLPPSLSMFWRRSLAVQESARFKRSTARFKRSLRGSREVCAVQEKSARFKRSLRGSREVCAVQERKPDRPSLGQVAHLLQAPRRVNRRRTLTPDRRPKLTRFVTAANGSARPGEAGQGCAAGARADR